ncbi:MAG: 4Fe-4S binding protein [Candidatus Lokiarchaeota archaeon]|nr:4Fe-4S binding protein [Candidatus Lokiarchaeota archaeon]
MPRERFIPTVIDANLCHLCGRCYNACRNDAIVIQGEHRWVDYRKCTGCLTCMHVCPYNAIKVTSAMAGETLGVDIDAGKCTAATGCHECVDACPAGIYARGEEEIIVNGERVKACRACKACEAACPGHAVKVIQA